MEWKHREWMGLFPVQQHRNPSPPEWVAGNSRIFQCKLWFWHLNHSGSKMGFRAAGEEDVVWVSEQKEAEHLGRWHYTEQSAKSGPLTVESWDFRELTNFPEFPASGNSWVQSASQQLHEPVSSHYGRAPVGLRLQHHDVLFLGASRLWPQSVPAPGLKLCGNVSEPLWLGCRLLAECDNVKYNSWWCRQSPVRSGVCQHPSHWRLVRPPSRPPCHCGQTASWLESLPLGSKGAGEGGLRGGFRLLNAVIPSHTSRRAAIQSLPATPFAISSWRPCWSTWWPRAAVRPWPGWGWQLSGPGQPRGLEMWWVAEREPDQVSSLLAGAHQRHPDTLHAAGPCLAHPWAQLAHAGPPTPVLESGGGHRGGLPRGSLPPCDRQLFFLMWTI